MCDIIYIRNNAKGRIIMENEHISQNTEKVKGSFNLKKEVFEWFYTIVIALLIVGVVKCFLFDLVVVDGPSMFPTLVDGDRLVVTKLGYEPHSQDIIVLDSNYKNRTEYYDKNDIDGASRFTEYFKLPKELKRRYYVKRIIGMPGQVIDLVDGKVTVDGKPLSEPYYTGETFSYDSNVSFPVTVEEGCVFVMGDNRPQSKDSRSSELGQVPEEAIMGKCSLRIWPLNKLGNPDVTE